jgi:hypothetical protein
MDNQGIRCPGNWVLFKTHSFHDCELKLYGCSSRTPDWTVHVLRRPDMSATLQTLRSSLDSDVRLDPARQQPLATFSQRTISAPALPQMWPGKPYAPSLLNTSTGVPLNQPTVEPEDLPRSISDPPAGNGVNAISRSASFLSLSSCLWMNSEELRLVQAQGELLRTVSSEFGAGSSAESSLKCHDPCFNGGVFQMDQSWAGFVLPVLSHSRK